MYIVLGFAFRYVAHTIVREVQTTINSLSFAKSLETV